MPKAVTQEETSIGHIGVMMIQEEGNLGNMCRCSKRQMSNSQRFFIPEPLNSVKNLCKGIYEAGAVVDHYMYGR